jgi:hypothetical protein
MRTIFLLSLTLVHFISVGFSQSDCLLTPELEAQFTDNPPGTSCFNVDSVQKYCTTIYVKVNVHFFLNDNCQGNVATASGVNVDLSPQNAFQLADNLISDANAFFQSISDNASGLNYQWNTESHNTVNSGPQCIPIRYVLSGVKIHCNTNAQNTVTNFTDFNSFEVNGSSEMNIYVSNVNGGTNGFASNGQNDAVVENLNPGLLNHELGHGLNLDHTHGFDNCEDTWDYNWTWDSDCDGDIEVANDKCWDQYPKYNDQDACDTSLFCQRHPCCEWSTHNNNLMTYSQWGANPMYSALTPCQIKRMLTDISNMCDFVEQIGGNCPPPKSNIGVIPTSSGVSSCPTCFYLSASFNDKTHEIKVLNGLGNVVVNSGIVSSKAGKYCITPKYDKYGNAYWPNGFQSGQTYTLLLKVYNECGVANESQVTFTLPPPCTIINQVPEGPKKIDKIALSPNPTNSIIKVKYNVNQPGRLKVYGFNLNSINSYGLIYNQVLQIGDEQEIHIDVTSWQIGTNSLILQYEDEIYFENFIKQ